MGVNLDFLVEKASGGQAGLVLVPPKRFTFLSKARGHIHHIVVIVHMLSPSVALVLYEIKEARCCNSCSKYATLARRVGST